MSHVLLICSCGEQPVVNEESDNTKIIQRIELLERRVDVLIDQAARDEARRAAEEAGFKVREIDGH